SPRASLDRKFALCDNPRQAWKRSSARGDAHREPATLSGSDRRLSTMRSTYRQKGWPIRTEDRDLVGPVSDTVTPRRTWRPIALGAILLVAVLALGRAAGHLVPPFVAWVHDLGAAGPVIFIAGYAVAVVAFLPAVLFTLAAGAIFGLVWGTVY